MQPIEELLPGKTADNEDARRSSGEGAGCSCTDDLGRYGTKVKGEILFGTGN